jgi:transglutaminase-like putative cysteine protease
VKLKHTLLIVLAALFFGWAFIYIALLIDGEPLKTAWMPVRSARLNLRIEPNEPHVREWATKICQTTSDPLERVAMAEQLVAHKIAYTSSSWINGHTHPPTVGEVIEQGEGNCVAQSIVLASLCRSLGQQASICTKADHAWTLCEINASVSSLLPVQMQPALTRHLPKGVSFGFLPADRNTLSDDFETGVENPKAILLFSPLILGALATFKKLDALST